ncbi:MAG: hypothetical protein ACXVAY_00865 [Mucilaginibacter sp.]
MALIGLITYTNTYNIFPTPGSEDNYADVYITLIDIATGQPTNGNNVIVSYQVNDSGNITNQQVTVPGQSVLIYSGLISQSSADQNGAQQVSYYKSFSVINVSSTANPSPPVNSCDLKITAITIDKPESAPGANDAQITASASSSYLPINYSIDNVNFQTSGTFTGQSAGIKTVYVTDANSIGCAVNQQVTVPVLTGLLVSDPAVTIGANISRWNAAFNPIVFTYQRKDFEVTTVTTDSLTGYATLTVNTNLAGVLPGDTVYVNCGTYTGTYNVTSTASNQLVINTPYTVSASGFININRLRPYYQLLTQVTYQDKILGRQNTITSTNRPNSTGLIKADLSNFLQSLLRAKDESDFSLVNFRDDNLSASYQIAYAQHWDDGTSNGYTSAWTALPNPYYIMYAAKQLGDKYGGNLAAYVPFKKVGSGISPAKWLTDFAEPAYSPGYPFDLSFIYGEDLAGLTLSAGITLLDINKKPLSNLGPVNLLNEDGSFLSNQDATKLLIRDSTSSGVPMIEHIGLNRLLINDSFSDDVYYFLVNINYTDNSTGTPIVNKVIQDQLVRIDKSLDYNSVYLRWIGLTGSWNYFRFIYNQEISLDVQNATIIKNYVFDWENQDAIEEVIGKSAGQKVKVMAEDLSVADIKGLQSIKYSPKVQMLINKNPVKWQTIVLNTATFSEYETLNGTAPFSVTFNLPSINIQTQ